ncbi:DNA-binding transcriptional ArsR family regulator [Rhizobium sp. BK275]|uniref:ArsR/SmtB family transcription factor n=1 Tax=unclassified Rhizobium TaxID=2613769 RepID=UPI0016212496|nr:MULTISPECIES: metalloregulator ArsR/SmtB family transcription factor [unclassified Rhizobium]MBB3388990.1 DNA-binding transcriptional ArsR family regulator [Rhizobium sp. BK275]MBB3408345.1 DNA-binding transcriptional ArsR family regulator [Rhizobium sp. BK316]
MNTDSFEKKAELLLVMANAHRLRMLQTLAEREVTVNNLADIIGISQSALSQHLAKLRSKDLVKTRRDAQTIYYSVKSDKVHVILEMLRQMFDEGQAEDFRLAV